jgi:hypothetical protein
MPASFFDAIGCSLRLLAARQHQSSACNQCQAIPQPFTSLLRTDGGCLQQCWICYPPPHLVNARRGILCILGNWESLATLCDTNTLSPSPP